jgi:hypothetical protein
MVPNSLLIKIIAVNSEFGKQTVNSIKLHLGNNLFGKKVMSKKRMSWKTVWNHSLRNEIIEWVISLR